MNGRSTFVSVSAHAVLLILQSRYDYLSARTVLKAAAAQAGVNPAGPFDAAALQQLATGLLTVGVGVAKVAEALRTAAAPAHREKAPAAPPPVVVAEPEPPKAPPAEPQAQAAEAAPTEEAAAAEDPAAEDAADDAKDDAKGRPRGKSGKRG